MGSKKEASLLLRKHGVKGITYDGRQDGRCFVVFDDKDVDVIQKFYQTGVQEIDNSQLYKALSDDLREAVDFIYNADPVYEITGNEFPNDGNNLKTRVLEFFEKKYSNEIKNTPVGDVIRPKYQREYIYGDKNKIEVINPVMKNT